MRAQIAPSDPALAALLIATAQEIIDALTAPVPGGSPGQRLSGPTPLPPGKFQMRFTAPHGRAYFVEASTDLTTWRVIGVARNAGDGMFDFEDLRAAQPGARFYRVVAR